MKKQLLVGLFAIAALVTAGSVKAAEFKLPNTHLPNLNPGGIFVMDTDYTLQGAEDDVAAAHSWQKLKVYAGQKAAYHQGKAVGKMAARKQR